MSSNSIGRDTPDGNSERASCEMSSTVKDGISPGGEGDLEAKEEAAERARCIASAFGEEAKAFSIRRRRRSNLSNSIITY